MAVPKRKTSPSRRNMRRAHDALRGTNVVFDANGDHVLSHHICLKTGMYKGNQVFAKKSSITNIDNSAETPATEQ